VGGGRLGKYVDFSFLPKFLIYTLSISLGFILYSQRLHRRIFDFLLLFFLPCAMSANAEIPNAWEDDWESQADVSSPQSPPYQRNAP
jgi:hypothetical protein